MPTQIFLTDSDATARAGASLLSQLPHKAVIFLHGDLGAGKTTFVRGLLRAAGVCGAIKSPTYSLVEEYEPYERKIFHFDLYRLAEPDELEWIGIYDYLEQNALCLIEWAKKGSGILPSPDIEIVLTQKYDGRLLEIYDKTHINSMKKQ